MKVLFITSCLDAGGAEKWCRDTLLNMDRKDLLVDYYYFEDMQNDTFLSDYQEAGIHLYFRELNKKNGGAKANLSRDLSRFIREHGPYDAAHINGLNLIYLYLLVNVLYAEKIPVRIVHSHNSLITHQNELAILAKNYFRSQIIRKATVIGACSVQAGISRYGDNIVDNPKFFVIKNGIDTQKYEYDATIREKIRSEIKAKTIYAFVGRLELQKNPLFLADIYAAIHKKEPDSFFLIIGTGSEEKKLKDRIKVYGISNSTIFIPWTDNPSSYYHAADVLLLPSLYEGFGFVTLEAQCSGLPCLVSDRIPTDSNVTHRIVYKSLADSAEQWAETAMQLAKQGRYDGQREVRDAGYDLMDTAAEFKRMLEGKNKNEFS